MNTAIKIHIHFLITNHSNLSHLPSSSTMRRGKCVWAPSSLDRDAFSSGRKLLCMPGCTEKSLSLQGSGGGGEAIIWNTTKEVLKWSPHGREVAYFLNMGLHKFSQNMSPWIHHFSPGWKDKQIQLFWFSQVRKITLWVLLKLFRWHDDGFQIRGFWGSLQN